MPLSRRARFFSVPQWINLICVSPLSGLLIVQLWIISQPQINYHNAYREADWLMARRCFFSLCSRIMKMDWAQIPRQSLSTAGHMRPSSGGLQVLIKKLKLCPHTSRTTLLCNARVALAFAANANPLVARQKVTHRTHGLDASTRFHGFTFSRSAFPGKQGTLINFHFLSKRNQVAISSPQLPLIMLEKHETSSA